MKPSEMLMLEINAYTKWSGYKWYKKKPLYIDGVCAVNGIMDYTLYTYYSIDIKELVGTNLKRGDILVIASIDNHSRPNECIYFYINKDHCYTEYDIWNPDNEIFAPLEALDGAPLNQKELDEKYQSMMDFVKNITEVPKLDRDLIYKIIQYHGAPSIVRCSIDDDAFEYHHIRYVYGTSGIGYSSSDTIDKYVTCCRKGDILVVTYYTGYGWAPSMSNTVLYIGVMDVTEEEVKKRGLKFSEMYKDLKIND